MERLEDALDCSLLYTAGCVDDVVTKYLRALVLHPVGRECGQNEHYHRGIRLRQPVVKYILTTDAHSGTVSDLQDPVSPLVCCEIA